MIGNSLVMSFESKLKIREYAEGYRLFDLRRGKSSGRVWKSSVFFAIAIAMMIIIMLNSWDITRVPVACVILLVCIYMCSYYLYMLPKRAKLRGEHIFKSSKLLSKNCKYYIYRDHFIMKSENETLKRYYTELTDCIETDDIFLLIGGFENRVTVISKRYITQSQRQLLSEHFQRETIRQYRRIKPKRKNKQ